ncbi:MAG: hypothetical protein K9N46_08710 [Candidatus Marinimicrobia bacterium]|nr:hypothetical protein [Candidatus Neomarinimicrobiota bacterium]MCF7880804.1 hypothetical protein [Candidatus Neomarinimicrobiota bacterium]
MIIRAGKARIFLSSFFIGLLLPVLSSSLHGQSKVIATVAVSEPVGLDREHEIITFPLQIQNALWDDSHILIAVDRTIGDSIPCQVLKNPLHGTPADSVLQYEVAFPVQMAPHTTRKFDLTLLPGEKGEVESDLSVKGEGTELEIENRYYRADLTRSNENEVKDHASGQLRELYLKKYDTLLRRSENRIHWAPTFEKWGVEYYKTIATWDNPKQQSMQTGPYFVQTIRRDTGPEHPEIMVTAQYRFFDNLPYFTFYSDMTFQKGIWMNLLRNDEMTMDSLFTHVAFQRKDGSVVDLPFSDRYELLEAEPIANDVPWLCFYHHEKGYAFGSIRLLYDNTNIYGLASPVENPHTHISDGAGGGNYWNRRLIYEDWLYVPEGSRYREKNAYIVFSIGESERFRTIEYYAKRLRNPLDIRVIYE